MPDPSMNPGSMGSLNLGSLFAGLKTSFSNLLGAGGLQQIGGGVFAGMSATLEKIREGVAGILEAIPHAGQAATAPATGPGQPSAARPGEQPARRPEQPVKLGDVFSRSFRTTLGAIQSHPIQHVGPLLNLIPTGRPERDEPFKLPLVPSIAPAITSMMGAGRALFSTPASLPASPLTTPSTPGTSTTIPAAKDDFGGSIGGHLTLIVKAIGQILARMEKPFTVISHQAGSETANVLEPKMPQARTGLQNLIYRGQVQQRNQQLGLPQPQAVFSRTSTVLRQTQPGFSRIPVSAAVPSLGTAAAETAEAGGAAMRGAGLAAGAGALGVAGAAMAGVATAAVATAAALAAAAYASYSFARSLKDVSPHLSAVFAVSEAFDTMRGMRIGQQIAPSTQGLEQAIQSLKSAMEPIQVQLTNLFNGLSTAVISTITDAVTGFNKLYPAFLTKMDALFGSQTSVFKDMLKEFEKARQEAKDKKWDDLFLNNYVKDLAKGRLLNPPRRRVH